MPLILFITLINLIIMIIFSALIIPFIGSKSNLCITKFLIKLSSNSIKTLKNLILISMIFIKMVISSFITMVLSHPHPISPYFKLNF